MNNNKMMEAFGNFFGGMVQGQGVVKLSGSIKIDFNLKGNMSKTQVKQCEQNTCDKEEIDVEGSFGITLEDFVADATISGGAKAGCGCEDDEDKTLTYEELEDFIKQAIESHDFKVVKAGLRKSK